MISWVTLWYATDIQFAKLENKTFYFDNTVLYSLKDSGVAWRSDTELITPPHGLVHVRLPRPMGFKSSSKSNWIRNRKWHGPHNIFGQYNLIFGSTQSSVDQNSSLSDEFRIIMEWVHITLLSWQIEAVRKYNIYFLNFSRLVWLFWM